MSLNLNNAELLKLLKRDISDFNEYRDDNPDRAINFSSADLQGADLRDAYLRDAYLRSADLTDASLTDADLEGANLWGADLQGANLADADLEGANFAAAKLQGSNLRGADLRGANFADADLRDAILRYADLRGANLRHANLRDVSFSLAKLRGTKLPYDAPAVPNIHQQLADAVNEDNLDMENWHSSCGTTHCRAGWVVTLAGEAGRELEEKIETGAAAALIYMASDPELEQIPDWAASNEDALADIQAMAEASK